MTFQKLMTTVFTNNFILNTTIELANQFSKKCLLKKTWNLITEVDESSSKIILKKKTNVP